MYVIFVTQVRNILFSLFLFAEHSILYTMCINIKQTFTQILVCVLTGLYVFAIKKSNWIEIKYIYLYMYIKYILAIENKTFANWSKQIIKKDSADCCWYCIFRINILDVIYANPFMNERKLHHAVKKCYISVVLYRKRENCILYKSCYIFWIYYFFLFYFVHLVFIRRKIQ